MSHQLPTRRKPAGRALTTLSLLAIFAVVHFFAYWLRFDGVLQSSQWKQLFCTVILFAIVKSIAFARYRVTEGWGRFVTFHDLVLLAKASTIAALLLAVIDYLLLATLTIPRSIFLMDWGGTIVVVGGLRAVVRWLQERDALAPLTSRGLTRALIVGTNDAGEALLRAICRSTELRYRIVGFIAERLEDAPSRIGVVPVVGELAQTCEVAERLFVREVLIAAGKLPGQEVRRLVEQANERNIVVKVVPSYEQVLHGRVDLRPRSVSIEDLLGREPVRLDFPQINRWTNGKTIMVTGSAGSIGSEICRQVLRFSPARIVAVDRSESGQFFLERELRELASANVVVDVVIGDLNDGPRMNRLFAQYQPDIVFHAAAYKHVPLMQRHPGEAVKNIVCATRTVADLAKRYGAESFVLISTDKAVNPSSVMGACKRFAELYVQSLAGDSNCRFVTVRFGNVLDSVGSVVPIFREQIAHGGPLTVTHEEMCRFFMTIPEASQLVIQAAVMGRGGEIFVLDMGSPVRIIDLARDMIRLSGLREGDDISIEFVGLRPGEKLFEQLLSNEEKLLTTDHPKILVAESKPAEHERIRTALETMQRVVEFDAMVLDQLRKIVPEFQSGENDERPSLPLAA